MLFNDANAAIAYERAGRYASRGDNSSAYVQYQDMLVTATLTDAEKIVVLNKLLDTADALFDRFDENIIEVARQLLDATGATDANASFVLGRAYGFQARKTWLTGDEQNAKALLDEGEALITAAITAGITLPDVWGTLGGIYKRRVEWMLTHLAQTDIDDETVRAEEDRMLAAYRSGMERVPHAYPLINYVEQRAVVSMRRGDSRYRFIFRADDRPLIRRLDQALRARERQLAAGQDKPWAAFDIARGKHYLAPNVPMFLRFLTEGLQDARAAARSADDRWMVATTLLSLRQLHNAGVRVEGLAEGIALLEAGIADPRWDVSNWEPDGYLESELDAVAARLNDIKARLNASAPRDAGSIARLDAFLAENARRWTEEAEKQFEADARAFIERDCDPLLKKTLRIAWRACGAKAVEIGANAVVPGAGEIAGTAVEIIERTLKERSD